MPEYTMGHGGSVQVDAFVLPTKTWNRRPTLQKSNLTNSGSGGWQETRGTVKGYTGSVKAVWDNAQKPYPIGLKQGARVLLRLKVGESNAYASGYAIIDGPVEEIDNEQGHVFLTFDWTSDGPWTEPGQT